MKRVHLRRLVEILEGHRGTAIVAAVTRTEPRLLARSRSDKSPTSDRYPHGIEKLCLTRFILANRYQANVQAQRRREGHPAPEAFRASKLWGGKGKRIGRFLAVHVDRDQVYLVARPQSDELGQPVRIWERWINLATGEDIEGEELDRLKRDYLRDIPSSSPKQQVVRRIPYRCYQVESVHSVTIGGQVFAIERDRTGHLFPT